MRSRLLQSCQSVCLPGELLQSADSAALQANADAATATTKTAAPEMKEFVLIGPFPVFRTSSFFAAPTHDQPALAAA
jgi:hypothetical protein